VETNKPIASDCWESLLRGQIVCLYVVIVGGHCRRLYKTSHIVLQQLKENNLCVQRYLIIMVIISLITIVSYPSIQDFCLYGYPEQGEETWPILIGQPTMTYINWAVRHLAGIEWHHGGLFVLTYVKMFCERLQIKTELNRHRNCASPYVWTKSCITKMLNNWAHVWMRPVMWELRYNRENLCGKSTNWSET